MKTKPAKDSPGVKSSLRLKRWAADVLNQVEQLSGEEKFPEALELLLPLLRQFPHEITVLTSAVNLFDNTGMPWHRIHYLQRAADIDRTLLLDLVQSCAELGLTVLSMQALRRMMKYIRDPQELDQFRALLAIAESDIQPVIRVFALNQRSGEEGLRLMEEAQIALHMLDYPVCIQLNLQSAKNLKNFPPPLNNLSLAYFSTGQWKHAIQITRGVLESRSNDFQAQANLIHFLAWSGGLPEAQSLWNQIRKTRPTDDNTRRKLIETAAIIEDDQVVYELLHSQKIRDLDQQARFYLAVAEANLGKFGSRQKLFRLAAEGYPVAREILTALKNGKKGRGYSERFSYKQAAEFLPDELRSFYAQVEGSEDQAGLSKKSKERAARYPQLILSARKLIYEEDLPEAGCQLLFDVATPESFAILRNFGTGQVGGKQARMHALKLDYYTDW
jgi:tetratricopeptide (TPR) repeat protein